MTVWRSIPLPKGACLVLREGAERLVTTSSFSDSDKFRKGADKGKELEE
jgi:hypothetical protein